MVQFDKEIMPCSDHSSKRQLVTSNASRNATTFWTTIVVSGFSCPLRLVNCRGKEHKTPILQEYYGMTEKMAKTLIP